MSPQVLQVLLSLHAEPRHGYAIIQDIRDRTGQQIRLTASTLYDALARLLDQGLIREIETPADERDSRRRSYELTALGRQAMAREIARLEEVLRSARSVRRPKKGTAR
jgi:DNA-binding PadR family transcriptional regulator